MNHRMVQHNLWKPQSYEIVTSKGKQKYLEWCQDECERIMANDGRIAELRYNKAGQVSVWVNDIADRYYHG